MTTSAPATRGDGMIYEHTQRGWIGLVIGGAVVVLVIALMLGAPIGRSDARPGGLVAGPLLVVLIATMLVFSTLTIRVEGEALSWRFGMGLVRKQIPLADIASVSVTRTSPWAGIGIRWLGGGWLYNVASGDAIEIVQRNGTRTWLGTDEPQRLHAAIERARGR
jgi:hypothetical protein